MRPSLCSLEDEADKGAKDMSVYQVWRRNEPIDSCLRLCFQGMISDIYTIITIVHITKFGLS